MFGIILLLFLVVPLIELYVIIRVADSLGVLETIGLLVLVSFIGAWLVKFQGLGVIRRIQQQLTRGVMPATELVDGALVLFAGALMLTPGFVTDAVGLLLLIPPTRAPIRALLIRQFRGRVTIADMASPGAVFRTGSVDVDGYERDPDDPDPPEAPPRLGS